MQNQTPFAQKASILLADDDLALRKVLAEVLREEGYHVILAADGKSALSVARKHEGPIDLLITDVMMPRLDGFDLQEKIQLERSGIRILVMSGALDEEITGEDFPLLRKPFRPEEFLEKVRQVLDAPSSRAAY
jgi:DNA-binding response OmpR family regulator